MALNLPQIIKSMRNPMPHFCEIVRGKIHFPRTRKYIPLQEIVMLEGVVNYTLIHLQNNRRVLVPRTLKLFEIILKNHDFLRTHRGFIINCEHLQAIDNEGLLIKMTDNLQANVSRRRKEKVNERLHFQV